MLVKITKAHSRALDPRTVVRFETGHIDEYEESLAKDIIKNGFGVEHKQLKAQIENKAIFEVPENKIQEVKENKDEEVTKENFKNKRKK